MNLFTFNKRYIKKPCACRNGVEVDAISLATDKPSETKGGGADDHAVNGKLAVIIKRVIRNCVNQVLKWSMFNVICLKRLLQYQLRKSNILY